MARTTRKVTSKKTTLKEKKAAAKKTGKRGNAEALAKAREEKKAVQAEARKEAERKLPQMAKEINVRLEKAEKFEHQADDHRLAAALVLGEAKTRCQAGGINFREWAEYNVTETYGFQTIRKLAAVGQADDPSAALEDMRGRNREANKQARERKKKQAQITDSRKSGSKESYSPTESIEKGFNAISSEKGRRNVLQSVAEKEGLVVIDRAEADKLKKAADGGAKPSGGTTEAYKLAQDLFSDMTAKTKMSFLKWACEEVGAKLDLSFGSAEEKGDPLDIPPSLDRRKTKGSRTNKAAKKKAA